MMPILQENLEKSARSMTALFGLLAESTLGVGVCLGLPAEGGVFSACCTNVPMDRHSLRRSYCFPFKGAAMKSVMAFLPLLWLLECYTHALASVQIRDWRRGNGGRQMQHGTSICSTCSGEQTRPVARLSWSIRGPSSGSRMAGQPRAAGRGHSSRFP